MIACCETPWQYDGMHLQHLFAKLACICFKIFISKHYFFFIKEIPQIEFKLLQNLLQIFYCENADF